MRPAVPAGSEGSWPGRTWYSDDLAAVPTWPAIQGRQRCRVAIIGAGLAGLNTAIGLAERGETDLCLLEAGQPGEGASGRNGGFVFAGYSLNNQALIRSMGQERARLLHGWTRAAVKLIGQRAESLLDCRLDRSGVLLADWFHDDAALQAFADAMSRMLDFQLEWIGKDRLDRWLCSRRYGSALLEPGSFHLHPLRYVHGLAGRLREQGVALFGHSPVQAITRSGAGWRLDLGAAEVFADEVVLATGGYERGLVPALKRAVQPVATYIAVTEPLESLPALIPSGAAIYDTRFAFDYYRPLPDRRLLWGGRISMAARSPVAIRRLLQRDMQRVFPELRTVRLDYAWGGWMSYATHQMPLLGRTPDGVWHATGFGGHGMAPTTVAGEVLAEAMTGNPARLDQFAQWAPGWAGGSMGRALGQMGYWYLQSKDALRSLCRKFPTSS